MEEGGEDGDGPATAPVMGPVPVPAMTPAPIIPQLLWWIRRPLLDPISATVANGEDLARKVHAQIPVNAALNRVGAGKARTIVNAATVSRSTVVDLRVGLGVRNYATYARYS